MSPRRKALTVLACIACFGVLAGTPTDQAEAALLVDFGQSVSGTVTPEAGWNGFVANTNNQLEVRTYAADFGTGGVGGDEVTVRLTAPYYRSHSTTVTGAYGQVTGVPALDMPGVGVLGLNDVLSGAALMNNIDQIMPLELDDLADGTYALTTFHHSDYASNNGTATLDMLLTDAFVSSLLVQDNVPVTIGLSSPSFSMRTTYFEVRGGSLTTFIFDADFNTTGANHATLDAFILRAVPEPSGMTLAGFGLAGLGVCFWRRRGTPFLFGAARRLAASRRRARPSAILKTPTRPHPRTPSACG